MQEASLTATTRSNRETLIGCVILLVLAFVAVGVFLKQGRYDPSLFTAAAPEEPASSSMAPGQAPATSQAAFQIPVPDGWKPLTHAEVFGPENLSDKIDGKAELYLSSGFQKLHCQRFAQDGDRQSWLEIFIYQMDGEREAFAVYSAQRRADARDIDLAQFAYRTPNAVFLVRGDRYIEIVAASDSEEASSGMLAFAQGVVGKEQKESGAVGEMALFPTEGLDAGSVALLAKDVFGFDRLDNVFTAAYALDGQTVTGYLSSRSAPEEASALADAYHRFLLENGGSDVRIAAQIPGVAAVEIFGVYDVMFTHGKILAGVHEAGDKAAAERLAVMLYKKFVEAAP